MNYKSHISSDLADLDALKLEFNHAKRTLAKLQAKDLEFGIKQHAMSGHRLWLIAQIDTWKTKVAQMDKIIIDFKNDEKARRKKEAWAEVKARAGYGRGMDSADPMRGIPE